MQNIGIWVSRLAAASLIGLVGVSGVQAQTSVLNTSGSFQQLNYKTSDIYSLWEFSSATLISSIGFADNNNPNAVFSYELGAGGIQTVDKNSLIVDADGIRWFTFQQPTQVSQGETLKLRNNYYNTNNFEYQSSWVGRSDFGNWSSDVAGVTYSGIRTSGLFGPQTIMSKTNGNIKVQNPGSNVAPEPGTFALALTGGGALLGICIRRRRNAA
jgi:hypothetical protein